MAPGAFVCYPNPSIDSRDTTLDRRFHLSAQGNALPGRVVTGYKVWLDDRLINDTQLLSPSEKFSIETNLESPFHSGAHVLRLEMDGAGSAAVKRLRFVPAKSVSFCDPFSRFDPRSCTALPGREAALTWSLPAGMNYSAYLDLYSRNLIALEVDTADAMAVDGSGNLYLASHAFSDVELRKYAPDGSLVYSSLIRSCSDGFMVVAALNVDDAGYAWIAGNTDACLSTTSNATTAGEGNRGQRRSFVILVDTAKPGSTPLYTTYLPDAAHRISGLFVDGHRTVYLTGSAGSEDFPHETSARISGAGQSVSARLAFVASLDLSGSGLRWSTLMPDLQTDSITVDDSGTVYLAGRIASQAVAVSLSADGRVLSHSAPLYALKNGNTPAIGLSEGHVIVAGVSAQGGPTVITFQPCRSTLMRFLSPHSEPKGGTFPDLVFAPALKAFSAAQAKASAKDLQGRTAKACPENPIQ